MFLIEMFQFPIGIANAILSKCTCKGKSYENKWEHTPQVQRSMKQIDKELDVVNLVKV